MVLLSQKNGFDFKNSTKILLKNNCKNISKKGKKRANYKIMPRR